MNLKQDYVKLMYMQKESSLQLKPEKHISKYNLKHFSQLKRMIVGLSMAGDPVTRGNSHY